MLDRSASFMTRRSPPAGSARSPTGPDHAPIAPFTMVLLSVKEGCIVQRAVMDAVRHQGTLHSLVTDHFLEY